MRQLTKGFLDAVGSFIPPVKRYVWGRRAKEIFNSNVKGTGGWSEIRKSALEVALEASGRSLDDESTYTDFLGLEGGKKAYEEKFQQEHEMEGARQAFQIMTRTHSPDLRKIGGALVRQYLENANLDPETDAPYKDHLGLEGGKAQFDQLVLKTPQP